MRRQHPLLGLLIATMLLGGCRPQQPFYLFNDGDFSHYIDQATELENPDIEETTLDEVRHAIKPFSLTNPPPEDAIWDLELKDAIRYALANSKVMRSIGGQIQGPPDYLVRSVEQAITIYDPAIIETNPRFGVEAALAAFDASLSNSVFWEKMDSPRNTFRGVGIEDFFPRIAEGDMGRFTTQLSKTTAVGSTFSLTHNVNYDRQNISRIFTSDWQTNVEAEFRQPLLRGNGVQYNRIAGPGAIPGFNNGVMIARINTDVALADFEAGVRDLVYDVEVAYWELYFSYRSLHAVIAGRDSGLRTWQQINAEVEAGSGPIHEEARARQQYFEFRGQMEASLSALYAAERKLRYMMGLAHTDGRLIRPSTEPKLASWPIDYEQAHADAFARSAELRKQRWQVKRRELELIAARNYLLPRVDAVGTYRWLGLGDDLLDLSSDAVGEFDNAYQNMLDGNYNEWSFGVEMQIPLGFRKETSGVRHAQLNISRERARLQDLELEVSHQLSHAISEMQAALVLAQTHFNRRRAAQYEVDTAWILYKQGLGQWTLDQVLDAQRRLALAENAYYRSLIDYNKAIADVHLRKGTLLDYNGVYLTEGPWPSKALFDARRRARARDSSFYLDYGFTRPNVASRGPVRQKAVGAAGPLEDGTIIYEEGSSATGPEIIPAPEPKLAEPRLAPPLSGEPAGDANEPPTPKPPMPEPPAPVSTISEPDVVPSGGGTTTRTETTGDGNSAGAWRPRAGGHTGATRVDTRHETHANPSAAETDWTAASGARVQR